ncbi:MAG: YbaK/EbsC family protein [Christensenellales bacterium]|jgi:Ala-tRNA(Pro) deacylase
MLRKEFVLTELKSRGIAFRVFDHPPVMTADEAARIREAAGDRGRHCKNLFLTPVRRGRNEKFWLLAVPIYARPDLKALGKRVASAKFELGGEEQLAERLGVKPGSVSPLALVYPGAENLPLLLDSRLGTEEFISFHPGVNTSTCVLEMGEFRKFLSTLSNPVTWIDIPEQDTRE